MNCFEFIEKTTDYLECALTLAESREWKSHAGACADCARYAAQIRVTIRLLAGLTKRSSAGRGIPESC